MGPEVPGISKPLTSLAKQLSGGAFASPIKSRSSTNGAGNVVAHWWVDSQALRASRQQKMHVSPITVSLVSTEISAATTMRSAVGRTRFRDKASVSRPGRTFWLAIPSNSQLTVTEVLFLIAQWPA